MSLRVNLSSTMRRLAIRGIITKPSDLTSSRILSRPVVNSHKFAIPQQVLRWSSSGQFGNAGVLYQPAASFHLGVTKSGRNDTRIDESLNRLDVEIRKVGRIRRNEVDEILEDIKEMKKATSSQSLMIIRCCGELIPEEPPNSRTELVQQVWKTLESLNVPMDVSHFNALLRVYLENEHKFNPTEFLQDLTSKGIEPNRVTYQRLIARFCQDGDIDGASTILQHMKEKQMPINEYVFNALILGHGQAKDMESAEGILSVMKQAGLEPNDDTYVTLMTCFAKQGDMKNVHRLAKECEDKEVFLMDRDFLNIIAALAENNHDTLIEEIIPYLKKHSGFNQEATNLIFKLLNMGKDEIAFNILKQMTPVVRSRSDSPVPSGNFFIKHLIYLDKPSDVIVKYCNALKNERLHENALSRAAEFSLMAKKFDLAVDLFEAMRAEGLPIRQHYFWPFIATATSERELHFGFKCMRELGLFPNAETLREYGVPRAIALKNTGESLENALHKLSSSAGVSIGNVASAALIHLLYNEELSLAVNFASSYRIPFGNLQLRRAIVEAYLKTKDAASFVKIIGSAGMEGGEENAREFVGVMLLDLVSAVSSKNKAPVIQPVLKELLAHGLGLSNSGSELLQNNLGESLTPELANTIIQLTSPELVPKISIPQQDSNKRSNTLMEEKSTEELETLLAQAQSSGGNTKVIKKGLLYSYCRNKDTEKAIKLRNEMSEEGFVFTQGLKAMFLELYVQSGMLEEAKREFNELKEALDFRMDDIKILRYAQLLQSSGDYEGCCDVLKNTPRDESRNPMGAAQQAIVWKLLNSVTESGPEKTKELFNLLKERNLTPINNVTLGALIKAHLVKDDLNGALEEFERIAQEHKATPWKQELFSRFIKVEDADKLQKVMDLSTNIHGEVNSMYDLVFAFIDCGKLRQAKKILETPGLRARNDKIESYCQKYFQESRVEELENLLQVTKDMTDIDRNTMYFYLLQAYCKMEDPDKALSVWTNMQEENVQPSVELLIYLADFLRKSNRPIPFVVPDASELPSYAKSDAASSASTSPREQKGLPASVIEFRKCIEMNEIDKALQIHQRMGADKSSISLQDTSNLIERLARAERLNEASRLTEKLLETGAHPYPRVLRFLTARMGSAGDISSLEALEKKLSSGVKGAIMMNSRLCYAYINANRGVEFFENKIKKVVESAAESSDSSSDSSDDEGVSRAEDDEVDGGSIPVFSSTKLLLKNDHLLSQFENLATTGQEKHRKTINNILWGFYILKKDFGRASQIWNESLKNAEFVQFRNVMLEARTSSEIEIAKETVNHVLTSEKMPSTVKGSACASELDIMNDQGKIDEALNRLDDFLKVVNLEDIPTNCLVRLKGAAESANKTFKYTIPPAAPREEFRRRRNRFSASGDN